MKPLEQMNIVDDFLAGSLIGHKEYGEAASRYILSCILNRKIGKLNVVTQKFLIGDNPERHGIIKPSPKISKNGIPPSKKESIIKILLPMMPKNRRQF